MRSFIPSFPLLALAAAIGTQASAQDSPQQAAQLKQAGPIEEVTVMGVRRRLYEAGALKDITQKTEVLSSVSIERSNAANLTDAIAEAPGVRVNNECSMCGVKRVMLNGLRGEHTTILIDGIPMHTMMSGFYGLDGASATGLDSIEIARGAGASLTAPEAIGGTINLVSLEPTENGGKIELAGGEDGYRKATAVGTLLSEDGATGVSLVAQYDKRDQFDGDNNGVSENPELENKNIALRVSHDLGYADNITLRLAHVDSEIFGGPTSTNFKGVLAGYRADNSESAQLFVNDDVREQFIGKPWETTEWIETTRREAYITWLHEFNDDFNSTLTLADTQHEQDSFYEGFDYKADNDMRHYDARFNWVISAEHLLTFGADARFEELRSQTQNPSPDYVSDSFNYDNVGLYIQDTWTPNDQLELVVALRFDDVEADFIDPSKAGVEVDETIVSPRMDMRYLHSDAWTSRVSVGRGYRAPLSFFESDHGLLDQDEGFDIDIDSLERSLTGSYALSYEADGIAVTASLAYTEVENLATLGANENDVPVLEQLNEDASVVVADIAMSYPVSDNLSLSATLENINYNSAFKQAFGVVPVEQRLTLGGDWEYNGWDVYVAASWVASRDLSEYGAPESPSFDAAGLHLKKQKTGSYWLMDFRIAKEFADTWQVYAGATNLFDYNQAADMETPLVYDGGEFDVIGIYGPLRGREAYVGVSYQF
ncbi:MAG: TonB-dependent receptor [Cellvibrionaceae bacterium]|nr:TonB-dependent receptor [Cellvibrionaceae bacterium]